MILSMYLRLREIKSLYITVSSMSASSATSPEMEPEALMPAMLLRVKFLPLFVELPSISLRVASYLCLMSKQAFIATAGFLSVSSRHEKNVDPLSYARPNINCAVFRNAVLFGSHQNNIKFSKATWSMHFVLPRFDASL
jgi:hypothetical protein